MNALTARHRREQLLIRRAVVRQLRRVWPSLDPDRLDETFPGWALAVAGIVRAGRLSASAAAAAYVRQLRAWAQVPGEAPLVGARPLPASVLLSSLGVTGPVAIKKSTARGVPVERASASAFVLSSLAVARHVLDAGRESVMAAVEQDDRAVGWHRVTSPKACEFCDSLDDIYPPGYGDFKAHDGCACSVEPVYS